MSSDQLAAELEAALLRELRACYDWENHARFGSKLTAPVLVLGDADRRLGQWRRDRRVLELSRALVLERPWPEVTAVLGHEMAHQFVDEVLRVTDESAHGETFRTVCLERGIDARAAGAPVPSAESGDGPDVDRALERIRKLFALAASANQHEAEVAMRRAHELMLRYNVEQAAARADRSYDVRYLGDPERRTNRVERDLIALLSEYFFVKVIRLPVYLPRIAKRGAIYELAGTRANLDMAVHVHAFLSATAERLWRDNRRDQRVRSGRDRLSYQAGVIRGFGDKLRAERVELRGTGLVWVGDRGLDAFYRARNPRIATRRSQVRIDGAHAAGREAGRTVVLHRPVTAAASAAGTRLLRD